jgi:hypothetical protein
VIGVGGVIRELDYEKLKKSLAFLFERYAPPGVFTPEAHPLRVLERFEKQRMSVARRGLIVAIADIVESMQDFSPAQVREADVELAKIGAYTLTFLRSHFTRRRQR